MASGGPLERVAKAQAQLDALGADALLVAPSADFRYFTGLPGHVSERLTALVIPREGPATLLVPQLEAPLYAALPNTLQRRTWADGDDPIAALCQVLDAAQARVVAVNDQLWSGFLLQLQEAAPDRRFVRGQPLLRQLRMVKDADELATLREAARRTDVAWEAFCASARLVGQTERALAAQLRAALEAEGLETVAFCIVASGPNAASPHHEPGDRVVQPGDPVIFDFGGTLDGYYSDCTRTVMAGHDAPPEIADAYDAVLEANQAAFAAIRPGVPCEAVDRAARQVLEDRGYGPFFIHRTGHGLGLSGHEDPYLVAGNREPLQPGMVVSDEPGVYLAGRWGIRIEDIVVVTEDGAERLNTTSHELRVLP